MSLMGVFPITHVVILTTAMSFGSGPWSPAQVTTHSYVTPTEEMCYVAGQSYLKVAQELGAQTAMVWCNPIPVGAAQLKGRDRKS